MLEVPCRNYTGTLFAWLSWFPAALERLSSSYEWRDGGQMRA